jgi:hypothetical protein
MATVDREIDDDLCSFPSSDSDDSVVMKGKQRVVRAKGAAVRETDVVKGKSSFLPAISFNVNSLKPSVPVVKKTSRLFGQKSTVDAISDESDPESEPETRNPKV